MTGVIFYDFPGLENSLTKFHKFLWPGDTLYTVLNYWYNSCNIHCDSYHLL